MDMADAETESGAVGVAEGVNPEGEVLEIFSNLQKVFECEQDKREVSKVV